MPAPRKTHLFTLLLIPAGLLFVITACAYAWMAVNAAPAAAGRNAAHPLFQWLRLHGDATLIGELVVLALITVGVIATDKSDGHDSREGPITKRTADGR